MNIVQKDDQRVYFSTLSGAIYAWDMRTDAFSLLSYTGLRLTDIAIAPNGRMFGITGPNLYQLDPLTGSSIFVGALTSPTPVVTSGGNTLFKANSFDISPNGVGKIGSFDHGVIVDVDLATGTISNPRGEWIPSTSSGDIWFFDDTSYAISTRNYGIDTITLGAFPSFSSSSEFIGDQNLFALFEAPANSTIVNPGTLVGVSASNENAYNLDNGPISTILPGFRAFSTFADISGAAVLRAGGNSGAGQFEFSLLNAAKLAQAAYALGNDNVHNRSLGNNDATSAYKYYNELFGNDPSGNKLTTIVPLTSTDGFSLTSDRGSYVNKNAGALIAKSGNDIFISFTGTNDDPLVDNYTPIATTGKFVTAAGQYLASKPDAVTANLAGAYVQLLGNILDAPRPNLGDYGHWIARPFHWGLFQPLVDDLANYIGSQVATVGKVYVTGHSLGAAMVPALISEFDNNYGNLNVKFEAITFASPGYNFGLNNSSDSRIANFWTSGDAISLPQSFIDAPGETNVFDIGIKKKFAVSDNIKLHEMGSYLAAVEAIEVAGLGKSDFTTIDPSNRSPINFNLDRAILQLTDANGTIEEDMTIKDIDGSILGVGIGSANDLPFFVSGNSLSNQINGERVTGNVFAGLQGDDQITGSLGHQDVFIFRPGDGNDAFFNFEVGLDIIDLRSFNLDGTPAQIAVQTTHLGTQLILDGGPESILLSGVTETSLGNLNIMLDDFVFA